MKLTLIAVGTRMPAWVQAGYDEYAKRLPREVFDSVWADLVELMHYAVDRGQIDTVFDDHTPDAMGRPPRGDRHGGEVYVYRRAGLPCWVCGSEVLTQNLAGRNLYWCPQCQPTGSAGEPLLC